MMDVGIDLESLLVVCDKVLVLNLCECEVCNMKGIVLMNLKWYQEVEYMFQEFIGEDLNYKDVYWNFVMFLMKVKKLEYVVNFFYKVVMLELENLENYIFWVCC